MSTNPWWLWWYGLGLSRQSDHSDRRFEDQSLCGRQRAAAAPIGSRLLPSLRSRHRDRHRTSKECLRGPVPWRLTVPVPWRPTVPVPRRLTVPVPRRPTEPVPRRLTVPVPWRLTGPVPRRLTVRYRGVSRSGTVASHGPVPWRLTVRCRGVSRSGAAASHGAGTGHSAGIAHGSASAERCTSGLTVSMVGPAAAAASPPGPGPGPSGRRGVDAAVTNVSVEGRRSPSGPIRVSYTGVRSGRHRQRSTSRRETNSSPENISHEHT